MEIHYGTTGKATGLAAHQLKFAVGVWAKWAGVTCPLPCVTPGDVGTLWSWVSALPDRLLPHDSGGTAYASPVDTTSDGGTAVVVLWVCRNGCSLHIKASDDSNSCVWHVAPGVGTNFADDLHGFGYDLEHCKE